uniref:TonB-dependent receptor domain-containing protein n=1 Tax=uncultured Porphyromonas sp. TaxID=159274 RepID=UPI00259BDFD8
ENDKVKVTGKGTPVIYINDRLMTDPNQMRELKPYLIKDIQVITNPGAKYSSSVGAVIKIYTRREPGSGLSGNLEGRLSKIKGCKLGYGTYISFNYRKDNWDFFMNSWNGAWRGISITDDATFIGKVGQNEWTNTSSIVSKFGGNNHNLTFGVNYSDDLQSAGVQYRLSANNEFLTGEAKLISSLQQNKPLYSFTEESKPWIYAHRPSLYYLRKIGNWKTQIDIDYYESTKTEKTTTTKRGYTEAYELKALKGRSGDKYQSAGARLDIDGPLWGGSLNVGGGYSWANNSFFNYSDPELKLPDLNSTLKEQTYVLYAEYSHAIAQKFMLTAGLRMEHVRNRYDNKAIEIKDYIKTNLFPTLSFGGQLWGVNSQLSFRSQINRPNFWRLQPGYQYLSEYEYQVGDPNLKPGLSYTTQLMLNKNWVTLMLTHEYKVNSLTQETQPMKDPSDPNKYLPHKTVLKHINAAPYSTLGGALVLSPRVKWWQPTFTVGGMKLIGYDLQHFEETITNRKPFIYLNWQNQFTLPKELTITANLNYLPAGGSQDNLDIIGAQAFLNTEISKRWLKDNALTTTFELNNLTFTPMKVRLVTKYTELTTTQRVMPQVTFTIAYRFNATKQKYQGKGALGSVIDRM